MVATMMMMPPMVGTPFLPVLKGSVVASRCTSTRLARFILLMNQFPKPVEMSNPKMRAAMARVEM
jgi:hypothetical protein